MWRILPYFPIDQSMTSLSENLITCCFHVLTSFTHLPELANASWDEEGFDPSDIPSALDNVLDKLATSSKAQQITCGGVSGWYAIFPFRSVHVMSTFPLDEAGCSLVQTWHLQHMMLFLTG